MELEQWAHRYSLPRSVIGQPISLHLMAGPADVDLSPFFPAVFPAFGVGPPGPLPAVVGPEPLLPPGVALWARSLAFPIPLLPLEPAGGELWPLLDLPLAEDAAAPLWPPGGPLSVSSTGSPNPKISRATRSGCART